MRDAIMYPVIFELFAFAKVKFVDRSIAKKLELDLN